MSGRRRRYSDEPDDFDQGPDESGARGVARVPGVGDGPASPPPPPPRHDDEVDDSGTDPLGLIPGPDETALLPRIPRRSEPSAEPPTDLPETRSKRSIRRHRDDTPVGGKKTRTVVRSFAEVLATMGAIVLLFSAYMLWGNDQQIEDAQQSADQQLADSWAGDAEDPTLDPVPGDAIARIYMPKIRPEPWIVVEGTTPADIETAPGRYEDGAMPGEKGNFAIAGHNVPAIFRYIDDLAPGDSIVVETKTKFFIYEVTDHDIVKPTNLDVVAPVPNQPGVEPGEGDRWVTLTTCHPWWDNYERYIVWGKLTESEKRGDELPPEATKG